MIYLALLLISTLSADYLSYWIDDARRTAPQTEEISTLFDQLKMSHYIAEIEDHHLLPIQIAIERTLVKKHQEGEITELALLIHTPTPLSLNPNENSHIDPSTWSSTLPRAHLYRQILARGGKICVLYPKGTLETLPPKQQNIYTSLLQEYPEHLMDRPLKTDQIDPQMVGATYVFRADDQKYYALSFNESEPPLFFGPLSNNPISDRVLMILHYLQDSGGIQ